MKAKFSFLVILAVLILAAAFTEKKHNFFEGKVVYQTYNRGANGKLIPSKTIGKQEYYFKNTFSKFRMEVKRWGSGLSFTEILVNTQDSSRHSVNHFKKTFKSLGVEGASLQYLPMEVKFIHALDTILGYPCKKYEMIQLGYFTQSPIKSSLWVAEDLKIKNLPLLARIFGYRNTVIKDGSFNGMILKYESAKGNNSESLLIQATEVKPMELEVSDFLVPSMYFPG